MAPPPGGENMNLYGDTYKKSPRCRHPPLIREDWGDEGGLGPTLLGSVCKYKHMHKIPVFLPLAPRGFRGDGSWPGSSKSWAG